MTSPFIPTPTQPPCCYKSALEADTAFCSDCGKTLTRCMAIEECGGLLDDHGLCTVCVSPELQIDAGASITANVGGAVAVPLSMTNRSVVGRPIFVTDVWSREAGGAWRTQNMGWERLAAGETRPISITASELERAGAHNLEILVAVASRWRWREEAFAFTASLSLTVDETSSDTAPVVNIGGESAGHGNVVYISGQDSKATQQTATIEAIPLKLLRADREERRLRLRGLDETHWVPKSAKFKWVGFAPGDAPQDGPISSADGLLAFGRSRTRNHGGLGDVRLLVEDKTGAIDEPLSQQISRRHFELYQECDRLVLRVDSDSGVRIGDKTYGVGKTVVLQNGDTISPLIHAPERLGLSVRMRDERGAIRSIEITRLPLRP